MSGPNTSTNKTLKVLVVDDTATNRTILQLFLTKLKMQVVTAENGVLAIEAFALESPDIIIMDVMMPVMDGFEATRRIKAMTGDRWVPVVFLSALDKEENLVAGLDAGGDDYLPKPVNFVVLEAKMRSLSRSLAIQRSLDFERKRAAAISDNLVDGVVTIDEKAIIQWCNPVLETIFGYEHGELIGKNINLLMPEPDHSQHDGYLSNYVTGGSPVIIGKGARTVYAKRKNGAVFPIDLGVNEMQVEGQRQFVGVIRDTTERVAAAEKLAENAKVLQTYHDAQEAETALGLRIVSKQMQRSGLQEPSVQHWLSPAAHFSGDVVAANRGPNGKMYAMLADATGHGLGAAICTLPVLTLFYGMSESGADLNQIVYEINSQLKGALPIGHFVAATLICITADGTGAEIWNGGTPNLLLLHGDGQLKQSIPSTSAPLGIIPLSINEIEIQFILLQEGDQFIMSSDGLIEAANADGEDFGYDRMIAALAAASPATRVDSIKTALTTHMGTVLPHDDVSILAITAGATS